MKKMTQRLPKYLNFQNHRVGGETGEGLLHPASYDSMGVGSCGWREDTFMYTGRISPQDW